MSATASPAPGIKRRDHRLRGLALVIASAAVIGVLVELLPGRGVEVPEAASSPAIASVPAGFERLLEGSSQEKKENMPITQNPRADGEATASQRTKEINALLRAAEKSIRAGRHDEAVATLNRAGPLDPKHAPTYLTMGHALSGKRNFAEARRYYEAAINFDRQLADAYFAHAAASEQLGELETALGGMRSFLHTVKNPDPYRLQVAQARSAIWEWEAQLGRGEWGKTGGIPPGFTAAELRRDGKGVGTKMPVPNSTGSDGMSQYEIKKSDKFNLFKP